MNGFKKVEGLNAIVIAEKQNIILAMRCVHDSYEYVTWQKDVKGGVCLGHYFDDFLDAVKGFVQRSEKALN